MLQSKNPWWQLETELHSSLLCRDGKNRWSLEGVQNGKFSSYQLHASSSCWSFNGWLLLDNSALSCLGNLLIYLPPRHMSINICGGRHCWYLLHLLMPTHFSYYRLKLLNIFGILCSLITTSLRVWTTLSSGGKFPLHLVASRPAIVRKTLNM